jgi:hypothetical protein
MRLSTLLHAVALLWAASLAAAQEGRLCALFPPQRAVADFGYNAIACQNCAIDPRARVWIIFHTLPGLHDIRVGGPAFGKLAEADTLLAIDGMYITTPEGSERYSTVKPGDSVAFTVRRKGAPVSISILTTTKCAAGRLPSSGVRGDRGEEELDNVAHPGATEDDLDEIG